MKKIIFYFFKSNEVNKTTTILTTSQPEATPPSTMGTAIAANDDEQSLYTIVENSLKDNVSVRFNFPIAFIVVAIFFYIFAIANNEQAA